MSQYMFSSDNLTREQIRKYNVSELQAALVQLDLPSTGKKHELVERVYQYWVELQSPSKDNIVNPTTSVRFTMINVPEMLELRSKLSSFGIFSCILFDPEEATCYVIYKSIESAQKFHDSCAEMGFEHARYVHESEVEKRSKELGLIKESAFLTNPSIKQFYRTNAEPKIFWCPNSSKL